MQSVPCTKTDKFGTVAFPKMLAWRPHARPLVGFKGPLRGVEGREREGRGKEGRGTEREKRGRNEERGRGESSNRAADWLRPALTVGDGDEAIKS